MSEHIKNKVSERSGSNHESVEEAVFKYVGEGFGDVSQENDETEKNNNKSLTLKGNDDEEQDKINHHDNNNDEQNTTESNNDNSANNSNNDDNSGAPADMTWYLKHEEDLPQNGYPSNDTTANIHRQLQQSTRDQDSLSNSALALAAVVAAYQSDKAAKAKRKNVMDDFIDVHEDQSRQYKKSKKHSSNTLMGNLRESLKKDKAQIAVDPELATLDEPSSENQLVNKAIAEADSISQQPDFQQYLNTEADTEALKGNHSIEDNLDKVNQDVTSRAVHDNISTKDFAELTKRTAEHLASSTRERSNISDTTDTINTASPTVNGKSNIGNNDNMNENDSNETAIQKLHQSTIDADNLLLENAATKASEIIGSAASTQTSGKAFDATEETALDHFIEEYQRIKKFTRKETCERIWTNGRRKDDFWINICKVLPYRTRSSIYKHVRRRYHIFAQRGRWTPEEDRQLADLCADKEGQWSEVGKAMGRMPEDCRDRWRNYIKCGKNRAMNKWSSQEEAMLKRVIANMLEEAEEYQERKEHGLIDTEHDNITQNRGPRGKKISGKPTFKDIINWTVVSEKMGGTRSRIQCRYKWNKLIRKQAVSKAEHIPNSEKRWLVEKLRDLGFTEDSQVDWDELATLQGNKWSGLELKVCYEKMRTMVKSYKSLTISEVSKTLMEILIDDSTIVDKE